MERYQPGAIVLQSGADSIAGDKLGAFNLSTKGHAMCHKFMASFGLPMLVLGGGGYKIKNVARLWAYETGALLGVEEEMEDDLPPTEFYELFSPDYKLQIRSMEGVENRNKKEELEKVKLRVLEHLSNVRPVGSQFSERPSDAIKDPKGGRRKGKRRASSRSDSDDEEEDEEEEES